MMKKRERRQCFGGGLVFLYTIEGDAPLADERWGRENGRGRNENTPRKHNGLVGPASSFYYLERKR